MQNDDYSLIEKQIGYEFHNRMLLQQAFTRKSYTNETHDGDNNEVLEFIGDKVLDKETHDDNGNPIWTCKCSIKDLDEFYYQTSYSKKEAKKQAAYQTLLAVLESENGGDQ